MKSPHFEKNVLAWALYDAANSAFATTVMAVFFPLFFKDYLATELEATTSTFWLGVVNGTSSFVLAVAAPWLGAMADRSNAHLRFLAAFTTVGIIPTALLALVGPGDWPRAAVLFAIASFGFWGGLIFYDALLVRIAPSERIASVSGFGYALGYLGGGLLLMANALMYQNPTLFGLPNAETAIRASFPMVAIWWLLLGIPLLRSTAGVSRHAQIGRRGTLPDALARPLQTLRALRNYRPVVLFLLAYWMYIEGVNTIMKMAVDYGRALGFSPGDLVTGVLVVQFIGFPATLLFGWLGDRVGPLVGIFVAIAVYTGVAFYAAVMTNIQQYFVLAVAIGCVQGTIQAMSRSYYGRLIPAERAGEFYGFYNMMGKFAAVLGPFLMGTTALLTGEPRMSMLPVALLFAAGAAMLAFSRRAQLQAECATSETVM